MAKCIMLTMLAEVFEDVLLAAKASNKVARIDASLRFLRLSALLTRINPKNPFSNSLVWLIIVGVL